MSYLRSDLSDLELFLSSCNINVGRMPCSACTQPSTIYWWQNHNISFEGTMLYCIKNRKRQTTARLHRNAFIL